MEYARIGFVPVANDQARRTGLADVDNPDRCAKPTADGCFLAPVDRRELAKDTQLRMIVADDSFVQALNNAKLERVVTHHSRWGVWAELLFQVVSWTLLGAVAGTYAKFRKAVQRDSAEADILLSGGIESPAASHLALAVAAVPLETVKATWSMMMRSARSGIKEQAHYKPKSQAEQLEFLTSMIFQVRSTGQRLREQLLSTLTDDELLIMFDAYHVNNHQPLIYEQQVATLMARFAEHEICNIGDQHYLPDRHVAGRLDVVRFVANGHERYAEVQLEDYAEDGQNETVWGAFEVFRPAEHPKGKKPPSRLTSGANFVRWIDDEFVDLAKATQKEVTGDILTVDVSNGASPFVAVILWAQQARSKAS